MGANHCLLIVIISILFLIGPSRFSFTKQKLNDAVVFRGMIILTTEILYGVAQRQHETVAQKLSRHLIRSKRQKPPKIGNITFCYQQNRKLQPAHHSELCIIVCLMLLLT